MKIYRHIRTGSIYHLIMIANLAATRPGWEPMAIYQDEAGETWARPLADFNEACEPLDSLG